MPQIQKFLATTALEEFWDSSQPILFLGEWCKVYDRKSAWENLDSEILQSNLLKHASSYEAYTHSIQIYDTLLPKIASWLNKIHHTEHSLRYWQIIVGPFLLWYIQVVYHRFYYLKIAYLVYPKLNTIGLEPTSYITPINTREFTLFASESDAWNLQLCTQILSLTFKKPISFQDFSFKSELKQREIIFGDHLPYKKHTKLKLNFVRFIAKSYDSKAIGLCSPMFERDVIKKLSFLSKFRLLPLIQMELVNQARFGKNTIDQITRNEITKLSTTNDFSRLVLETLKINMPMNFIECYKEASQKSDLCYPYNPSVIVGGAWMHDDLFKFWGAKKVEEGTRIIDIQHGGGFGTGKYSSYEYLGRKNCNAFISWGWKDGEDVIKAPSILICERFFERKWDRRDSKNNLILWAITETNRYLSYMESCLESMRQSYFDWQCQFAKALHPEVFSQVTMRIRPSSRYVNYLINRLPTLKIHQPTGRDSFFDQLHSTKILISDNLGTVFHYGLAFNIPTIIFWDKRLFELRKESEVYFKMLQDVGIYHDSPESAAIMLNKIANDPGSWWGNENVQVARKNFCDNFAYFSSSWVKEWHDMLLKF